MFRFQLLLVAFIIVASAVMATEESAQDSSGPAWVCPEIAGGSVGRDPRTGEAKTVRSPEWRAEKIKVLKEAKEAVLERMLHMKASTKKDLIKESLMQCIARLTGSLRDLLHELEGKDMPSRHAQDRLLPPYTFTRTRTPDQQQTALVAYGSNSRAVQQQCPVPLPTLNTV